MGTNILDLSNIESFDLIKELQSRGFNTELLWCRDDVQRHLDNINEDREEGNKVTLDEMEMDDILDSVSYDYHVDRINEEIYDKVWDYVKE